MTDNAGTTNEHFRLTPRSIQALLVKEFDAFTERVTKEKPYPEMFGLRTADKHGMGNKGHIVTPDGNVETLRDGTLIREQVGKITEGALVMEYYSSRGNTFKIYMGKEVAEIAPRSAASILLDDEE